MSDEQLSIDEVLVSVVDGRVRIGASPGAGPRAAVLPVFAGIVEVSPFRPHQIPHTDLQFYDADDRFGWLADVYGFDVARLVAQAGRDDVEEVLPWEPGWLHPVLARLAVARWLTLWGPAASGRDALDHRLLGAEIGHLTARCADAVLNAEDTAAHHLEQAGSLLHRLIEPALDEQVPGTAAEVAARAVRLWTGTAVALLGTVLLSVPGGPAPLRARRADDMAVEDAPLPVLAAALQVVDNAPYGRHVGTVDRMQVLPDLVDESPDAVSWDFAGESANRLVHVSVGGNPVKVNPRFTPWVRLYEPGRPLPVSIAPMRLVGEEWRAELQVRAGVAADSVVDVFCPELGRAARLGREAERAGLERDAANFLGRLRFAAYHDHARLPALAATARALAIEFDALPGPVDLLAATLSALAGEIDDATPVASEAWRLTIAELTRLDRTVLGPRYSPPT